MESFPPVPTVESDPSVLDGGHVWILEEVDGGPFRFRLREDGRIAAGDADRTFGGSPPPEYAATVRHVRESLDRAALRSAVEDVESVTFLGVATYRRRIDYDWDRLPPFVGTEVHDGDGFLGPAAAEGAFERLGLTPTPAVRKELRAADFDPGSYAIPDSAYRDGPALGVVLRTKTGERGRIPGPAADRGVDPDPVTGDPESVAAEFVTDARVDAVVRGLGEDGREVGFDAVFERVIERVYREAADRLTAHGTDIDRRAFRSAVASAVRERLGDG